MRAPLHLTTALTLSCSLALAAPEGGAQGASQAAQPPAAPAPAAAMPPAPPDVAAPPADAETTASGLAFKVLQPGTGDQRRPRSTDMVTIEYTGWTVDGKPFDSTSARGRPSTLSLERVMKGLSEGVQLMAVGEKRRLWVPEPLAFAGQAGRPKGMVVFDVALMGFEPSPTQAPADVSGPPADAKRTASGLAYRVIRPGTGSQHPTSRSRVTVHYTGWTTDGKMFDSSVARGRPATFGLDQVIKGWTEGVQLMVTGEKTRFWIPERLAYQGQAGAPRGMLVFDIELVAIEK
jgi:peptidylprolyl isomerase